MPDALVTDRPAGAALAALPRLAWLDVTRGLAIVAVVLYHTYGFLGLPSRFQGQAGVDAFLLLSGFGLAYGTRTEPWYRFLGRRTAKLLPAYWVVLALCVGFERLRGTALPADLVVAQALCLHLFTGDRYGFAVNMSFWFMGLIVPLYAWFTLIRRWVAGRHAYAALAASAAVAWGVGVLLLEYGQAWGTASIGHVPHRLPTFFVGAMAGVAFGRRETLDQLAREPWPLAALVLLVPVSVAGDWTAFPIALLTGVGVVAAGMFVSSLGERWRLARPLTFWLTGIGAVAFELYLCHQYVLVRVNQELLLPQVDAWFPQTDPAARLLLSALVSLAAAAWVAWAVRWAVAWRESRRTWRPTLAVVAVTSATLVAAAAVIPARLPKVRPRTFEIAVVPPAALTPAATAPAGTSPTGTPIGPAAAWAEPVVYFGHAWAGELVFLEHDGTGRARLGLEQRGRPVVRSEWAPLLAVVGRPVTVRIDSVRVSVEAGGLSLTSPGRTQVPNAKPVFGLNDVGFASTPPTARSRIGRAGATTAPATVP